MSLFLTIVQNIPVGQTVDGFLWKMDGTSAGQWWNNTSGSAALETFNLSNWTKYAFTYTPSGTPAGSITELGGAGNSAAYSVSIPSGLPAGRWGIFLRSRSSTAPAATDSPLGAGGEFAVDASGNLLYLTVNF